MAIDFKLPNLGENVDSGDIVSVLVNEGDTISAEQGVFEVETGKAVVELPCPHAGRIAKIHVQKGTTVKVGETLLTVDNNGGSPVASAPAKGSESSCRRSDSKVAICGQWRGKVAAAATEICPASNCTANGSAHQQDSAGRPSYTKTCTPIGS